MSIVFVVSSLVIMAYLPFGSASSSVGTRLKIVSATPPFDQV